MPFVKGKSGNPAGRPKGQERPVRETIAAQRAVGSDGIERDGWARIALHLLSIAMGETGAETRDQISAGKLLYERGWGQAKQSIEIDDKPELTDDEYAAECDAIARERIAAMTMEERLKLLADPAPSPTIQ